MMFRTYQKRYADIQAAVGQAESAKQRRDVWVETRARIQLETLKIPDDTDWSNFHDLILRLITSARLPFSFVEQDTFKDL
ncbi:hypothetical protein BGZ58_006421, partial [Dissophora ornata]